MPSHENPTVQDIQEPVGAADTPPAPVTQPARKRPGKLRSFFSKGGPCSKINLGHVLTLIIIFALIVMVASLGAQLAIDKGTYNDLVHDYDSLVSQLSTHTTASPTHTIASRVPARDIAGGVAISDFFDATTTSTFSTGTYTITANRVDADHIKPFLISGGAGSDSSTAFPTMTDVSSGISAPDCAIATGTVKTKTVTVRPKVHQTTSWYTWTQSANGTAVATNSVSIVLGKPGTVTETMTQPTTETWVITEQSTSTVDPVTITESASTSDVVADTTMPAETSVPAMISVSGSVESTTTNVVFATSHVVSTVASASDLPSVITSVIISESTIIPASGIQSAVVTTVTIPVVQTKTTVMTVATETQSSDTRPNLGGVPQTPPSAWSKTRYVSTSYWTTVTATTTPTIGAEPITLVTSGFAFTTSMIVEAASGTPPMPGTAMTWSAAITLPTEWTGGSTGAHVPLFSNSNIPAAMSTESANATLSTKTTVAPTTSDDASPSSEIPFVGAAAKPGSTGGYCVVMIVLAVVMILA